MCVAPVTTARVPDPFELATFDVAVARLRVGNGRLLGVQVVADVGMIQLVLAARRAHPEVGWAVATGGEIERVFSRGVLRDPAPSASDPPRPSPSAPIGDASVTDGAWRVALPAREGLAVNTARASGGSTSTVTLAVSVLDVHRLGLVKGVSPAHWTVGTTPGKRVHVTLRVGAELARRLRTSRRQAVTVCGLPARGSRLTRGAVPS